MVNVFGALCPTDGERRGKTLAARMPLLLLAVSDT